MNYYYHAGDTALYPMGHTPEVLFNKLYVSSNKIRFDIFAIRIKQFMDEVIAHPLVLFLHPGTMVYELSINGKETAPRFANMHTFLPTITESYENRANEMAVIHGIKARGDTFHIEYSYLENSAGLVRKTMIDEYLKEKV